MADPGSGRPHSQSWWRRRPRRTPSAHEATTLIESGVPLLNAAAVSLCLLAGAGVVSGTARGAARAQELPRSGIAYRIEARLDPETRGLKGTEDIRWTNTTGETVSSLPLHLYLNAFSHSQTTWMREAGSDRSMLDELHSREKDPWGYIEPVSIKQRIGAHESSPRSGGPALVPGPPAGSGEGRMLQARTIDRDAPWKPVQPDDGNPLDRSLAQIILPEPVPPGGEILLTIAFEGRLPVPIARTGGRRDTFLVGQWYPKIGVIEAPGVRHATAVRSAARQFHARTEFYADFADYDVTFTVPEGWMVGATGREAEARRDEGGLSRVRFVQDAVHDFALVAGRDLQDRWIRHSPGGGGPPVDVRYVFPAGVEGQMPRWRRALEGAMDELGSRVGPYPYGTLTLVMMPHWALPTMGMEYPTFITGASGDPLWDRFPLAHLRLPEVTIVHEFGHQYFYGLLASNEQEEAFLDEGFNSYWEMEIMQAIYGAGESGGKLFGRSLDDRALQRRSVQLAAPRIHEPIRKSPSSLYAPRTWGAQVYARTALTLTTAANLFGRDRMDRVFAEYFRRFAFRHPDAEDFLDVAEEAGGPEIAAFLREGLAADRVPDFAVVEARSDAWTPPVGRIPTDEGPVMVEQGQEAEHREVGLDAAAREIDGRILMEITDGGWSGRGGSGTDGSQPGTVTRSSVRDSPSSDSATPPFESGEASAHSDQDATDSDEPHFFESLVRVEGPGWKTLPVTIEFRFEDGVVVKDRWDGRSTWRQYRFLRPARLTQSRIDPEGRIVVDEDPANNALAVEPDRSFVTAWGAWFSALSQWVGGAVALWL